MKKIIALICVFALALTLLASCTGDAGADESDSTVYSDTFVPIKEGSATALYLATGSGKKDINTEEYREKAVAAYNSVTETKLYAPDRTADWSFMLICDDGGENVTYMFTGVGTNYINVTVTGPEGESKYLVVNEELYKFFVDEALTLKEVGAKVKVSISLGEGTPDGEGNLREAEVLIGETTVDAIGNEVDLPTALDAVAAALQSNEITEDYTFNRNSGTVLTINGYADDIVGSDEGVDILRWKYTINGEAVGSGDLDAIIVTDGTVITVVYTHEYVSAEE